MKIFEGNCITPREDYEGKAFLAPDGSTYSETPQIGWQIVEKLEKGKVYQDGVVVDEPVNNIHLVNATWETLPEPLKVQYAQHYPAIKTKLEANNPAGAIEYIGYLVPLVPEVYQPLLQEIVNKIKEVYGIEGE